MPRFLSIPIRLYPSLFVALFCLSLFGCAAPRQTLKVATYNIYFLHEDISPARRDRLTRVIRTFDADVIGFQEIQSKRALRSILPADYRIAILDDADENQELALAVRAPFRILSSHAVFPERRHNSAFPGSRDLLEVRVAGSTKEIVFLVHHAKSRSGGRVKTDPRRLSAAGMIVDHVRDNLSGQNVILVGDFNDNPDDRSLNALEYGTVHAVGGIDAAPDSFLHNATEKLVERDHCSYGLRNVARSKAKVSVSPVVPGSRTENNRWRNRVHDYRRDVKVKAVLFDQILVSMDLADRITAVGVFDDTSAVAGKASRVRFKGRGLEVNRKGDFASDHVPVWAEITLNTQ